MAEITFQPRWKELLDCRTPWGEFSVELTMGVLHVYFPDEARWTKDAPTPFHDKWRAVFAALEAWCTQQEIPLSVRTDAWVEFSTETNA